MKAIVFPKTGGPEVLEMREMPEPQPGAGEVAIRVLFAGVNYVEVMVRRGDSEAGKLPLIHGFEVSGYVHAIGEGVEGLHVGQPVAAMTVIGGYAEVAIARAAMTFPLDDLDGEVAPETAAAFPTIVPTAYAMLTEVARLRKGESVLIHAAAGGVGTVAAQIARHLGAGMILGTVSSREKGDYAKPFGYDATLLRDGFREATLEATRGRGVDVVLESIGGSVVEESLKTLAPLGKVVIFGNASNSETVRPSTLDLCFENKSVMGFSIGHLSFSAPERLATISRQALNLVAAGMVKIDITEVLPLERAAEAHRRLEGRATTGKLVLRVQS